MRQKAGSDRSTTSLSSPILHFPVYPPPTPHTVLSVSVGSVRVTRLWRLLTRSRPFVAPAQHFHHQIQTVKQADYYHMFSLLPLPSPSCSVFLLSCTHTHALTCIHAHMHMRYWQASPAATITSLAQEHRLHQKPQSGVN